MHKLSEILSVVWLREYTYIVSSEHKLTSNKDLQQTSSFPSSSSSNLLSHHLPPLLHLPTHPLTTDMQQDSVQVKAWSKTKLAHPQLVHMLLAKCCVYISAKLLSLCTQTVPCSWGVYCCLLHCYLPTATNLYIVGIPGCIDSCCTSTSYRPCGPCSKYEGYLALPLLSDKCTIKI